MKDGVQATGTESGKHHWSVDFGSLEEVYDVEARLQSDLAKYYTRHIRHTLERVSAEIDPVTGRKRQFGALVLEPICLGAGGMVFVDPLFQRCLMDVVRSSADLFGKETEVVTEDGAWQGLPVVFDEGVYRNVARGRLSLKLYPQYSPAYIGSHTSLQAPSWEARPTLQHTPRF